MSTYIYHQRKTDELCSRLRSFRNYLLDKVDLEFNRFERRIDDTCSIIIRNEIDKNPSNDNTYLEVEENIQKFITEIKQRQRRRQSNKKEIDHRPNAKQANKKISETRNQTISKPCNAKNQKENKNINQAKLRTLREPPMMNLTSQKQNNIDDDFDFDIPL